MEEFIENFNEFKDWLYERADFAESYESETFAEIIEKFESLGLDDVF